MCVVRGGRAESRSRSLPLDHDPWRAARHVKNSWLEPMKEAAEVSPEQSSRKRIRKSVCLSWLCAEEGWVGWEEGRSSLSHISACCVTAFDPACPPLPFPLFSLVCAEIPVYGVAGLPRLASCRNCHPVQNCTYLGLVFARSGRVRWCMRVKKKKHAPRRHSTGMPFFLACVPSTLAWRGTVDRLTWELVCVQDTVWKGG